MVHAKVLHDGAATGASNSFGTQPTTVYDGVYTSTPGGDHWNSTGCEVRGLGEGATVHFVHLDGNLKVHDSAAGTVFLNFMIQVRIRPYAIWPRGATIVVHFQEAAGRSESLCNADLVAYGDFQGSLNVSGVTLPAPSRPYPSVGAATVVGLTDYDINVLDDQSIVITDYYSEQIKTRHLTLMGTGTGNGVGGRVTIAAVKSVCQPSFPTALFVYVYVTSLHPRLVLCRIQSCSLSSLHGARIVGQSEEG